MRSASAPATAGPCCRILADDLTGALDAASAFAAGREVPVKLGASALSSSIAPVEACDLASRALPASALHDALSASVEWLAQAPLRFKKIDSLLRGNSFAELAWLAGSGRFRRLVVAPAFPAQGRFVRDGSLMLTEQQPGPSLQDALVRLGMQPRPGGGVLGATEIVIPDVLSESDLDAVVAAYASGSGSEDVLWCGSAGLAFALARAHAFAQAPGNTAQRLRAARVLVATGSRHPVLRAQLARLHDRISAGGAQVHLGDFASADAELTKEQADAALVLGAEGVVSCHSAAAPDLLLAVGGDSLLALCRAAGATAMLAGPPPRPGWGSARLLGGRWDGLRCLSRSGAFGAVDDLADLLDSISPVPIPAPHNAISERVVNP